jgi:hypothetical protein
MITPKLDMLTPLERLETVDFADLWASAETMSAIRKELRRLDFGAACAVRCAIRDVESASLADKRIAGARLRAICERAFQPELALAA